MKWDENYHDYAASVQSDKCGASLNLIEKMVGESAEKDGTPQCNVIRKEYFMTL